jgi:hypothetical protein
VTALLDVALYSFLPYYLGSLDLYGHRTIVNAHDSPHIVTEPVTGVYVPETCYRSDPPCCSRGRCLLYISRVFLLLSSLYYRIHAHGSPQLPYRNRAGCFKTMLPINYEILSQTQSHLIILFFTGSLYIMLPFVAVILPPPTLCLERSWFGVVSPLHLNLDAWEPTRKLVHSIWGHISATRMYGKDGSRPKCQ